MRVCLVSSELAPFQGWGVGAATASLARALRDAGHEVHLLIDDLPNLRERGGLEFPGIHIHILEPADFAAALDQFPCECTRRPLVVHRRLLDLHTRLHFDAIEFNDFFADAYFALEARRTRGQYANTVFAIHLHSPILLLRHLNQQFDFDLDIALITHMEAACIRDADLLISPSRSMLDQLAALEGLGPSLASDPRRIAVIPYALPPMPEPPAAPADPTPEVLFFGRLETRKGPADLITAAQSLLATGLNFRVRIVGVDTDCGPGRRSMREHLQRQVEPRWQANFIFQDNQPRETIAQFIRSAACCCFPALWDNFPNACLEAMSLGACVVASSAGGMGEMIEHDHSGLLVPPSTPDALADALRRALADPALRQRLGRAARQRAASLCHAPTVARLHTQALNAVSPATFAVAVRPRERVCAIVPVFNLGRTLPETLASLRAQTRPADEIIVVDDGSTDAPTLAALERLGPGVTHLRQHNLGLAAARNAALARTSAEWVLPLDADDLLAPTFIERCLDAASRNPRAAVISSHMACFSTSPQRPSTTFVPIGFLRVALPAANIASSAIALLRREAVVAVGAYDPAMTAYEDWDLYCRLAAAGHEAAIIPESLILNRVRPDSMLRSLSITEDLALRAAILTRHMSLSARPDRTARIVLARPAPAVSDEARAVSIARSLLRDNLRYRVADRVHEVSRALGVKSALKEIARRAVPPGPSPGPAAAG